MRIFRNALLLCVLGAAYIASPAEAALGRVSSASIDRTIRYTDCNTSGYRLVDDRMTIQARTSGSIHRLYYNELVYGLFVESPMNRIGAGRWSYSRTLQGGEDCYMPGSEIWNRIHSKLQAGDIRDLPQASFGVAWGRYHRYQQVRSPRMNHYRLIHSS